MGFALWGGGYIIVTQDILRVKRETTQNSVLYPRSTVVDFGCVLKSRASDLSKGLCSLAKVSRALRNRCLEIFMEGNLGGMEGVCHLGWCHEEMLM